MIKSLPPFMISILLLTICDSSAIAQTDGKPEQFAVRVQIVIATYVGDRKVSSAPYTILATANGGQSTFLDGTNLPIPTGEGKISYTNVGITIVCTVTTEGGNFKVALNFDDKSVVKPQAASAGTTSRSPASPSFRDRNYVGNIILKEGETKQLVATASDKTTGEVVKIDIIVTSDPPRRASIESENKLLEVATIAIPLSLN